uniref:Uncharacterized protein n=1 Tax=Meloidogyne incognita TaxID=6306 RepID=A0A914KYY3_MELIC
MLSVVVVVFSVPLPSIPNYKAMLQKLVVVENSDLCLLRENSDFVVETIQKQTRQTFHLMLFVVVKLVVRLFVCFSAVIVEALHYFRVVAIVIFLALQESEGRKELQSHVLETICLLFVAVDFVIKQQLNILEGKGC